MKILLVLTHGEPPTLQLAALATSSMGSPYVRVNEIGETHDETLSGNDFAGILV